MHDKKHSPYTIGFFTTGVELEYSYILSKTVNEIAKEYNVNIVNFLGGSLNPDFTFHQYKYQYQCNVAFNYADVSSIDGIILASGVLSSFLTPQEFIKFYSRFEPIPMVSLGMNITDMPSVYTDNKEIFRNLVSHLIEVHNRRHIAFISGPSSNCDALERYAGYMQALADHHITYSPEYVYIGDFTPDSAVDAIRTFLDERHLTIDAIVSANDSMALAALSELQKRNISVPEDIALTGCDAIHSTAYSVPSLTTIEQAPEIFARRAINILLDKIQGKSVENKSLSSHIIYRESCGCCQIHPISSNTSSKIIHTLDESSTLANNLLKTHRSLLPIGVTDLLKPFVKKCYKYALSQSSTLSDLSQPFLMAIEHMDLSLHLTLNLKHFIQYLKADLIHLCSDTFLLSHISAELEKIEHVLFDNILQYYGSQNDKLRENISFIRQFLLSITTNIHNKRQQLSSIATDLMSCGISSCLIYLYPHEIIHNLSDTWQNPKELLLYMGFIDGKILDLPDPPPSFKANDIVAYGLSDRNKLYNSYIHPIFFGNEQLGIIVLELPSENYSIIETLTAELGCALKLCSVFTEQKNIENKLQALSQTDELTGLLNRRGFFTFAEANYTSAKNRTENGTLFYADMDGLKTINDTYGHHEGDIAIKAMSAILQKTFGENNIIGRIGGDEFVILCLNKDVAYADKVRNTVFQYCDAYNAEVNKPYKLSISMGAIHFDSSSTDSLENLLSKADHLLYNAKKEKKRLGAQKNAISSN